MSMEFTKQADAWQTRWQSFSRLPFPLAWGLIAGVLFGVGYIIQIKFDGNATSLRALILLSTVFAIVSNSAIFLERLLDDVADAFPRLLDEDYATTEKWLTKWYDNIFWSRKNLIAGIAAGCVLAWIGSTVAPQMVPSIIVRMYIYFLDCAIGVMGGSLAWMMFGFARLTASLGRDVRIRPSIFDTSTSPLRAASAVLWKMSLIGCTIYISGLSVYFFLSAALNSVNVALIFASGAGLVLYFIVPQANIHRTLKRLKRERLDLLVRQIDVCFDQVAADPAPENMKRLKELFDLQTVVDKKKAWSFGAGELIVLLGSVLVPLLAFLLKYLLGI